MRIEFNKELLFSKEVTLLDIKSKFSNTWEKKMQEFKIIKKEEKFIFENVISYAIFSNNDNDDIPIIHIRFNMNDISHNSFNEFVNYVCEKFKIKGIENVSINNFINEERMLYYDNESNNVIESKEYVMYIDGINLIDIRYIHGIDVYTSICNDIIIMYEMFGIESARSVIFRELHKAYGTSTSINY
jgi:hypothetical protein